MKKQKPIILSLDPGKYHFAYSFIDYKGNILKTGMFPNSILDLKNYKLFSQDVKRFSQEVQNLTANKKLTVVFERFVPRNSMYMGNLIEITCMKIGIFLASINIKNETRLIPILASSWKNFYNKNKLKLGNDSAPDHIFDAISIGFYYLMHYKKYPVETIRDLTKSLNTINFGWYRYKAEWYFGERQGEHLRGKRNSFGN